MEHSRRLPRGRFARPALSALRRLAGWPSRVAAARAALRQLAGMSERELADVGLARQDLRDASALAPNEDSARALAMRVSNRSWR